MDNQVNDHRKFMKSRIQEYRIGGYFPNELEIDRQGTKICHSELLKSHEGSVIFVGSKSCSACDFDVIKQFMLKHNNFNYVMLLASDGQEMIDVSEWNEFNITIVPVDLDMIMKALDFHLIPWVFVLNRKGQILSAKQYNRLEELEHITLPLIRASNPDHWRKVFHVPLSKT